MVLNVRPNVSPVSSTRGLWCFYSLYELACPNFWEYGVVSKFVSELACPGCGRAAHVTWEGIGVAKRAVQWSGTLKQHPGNPPTFSCKECGTTQNL
jgi:hypothetical protein